MGRVGVLGPHFIASNVKINSDEYKDNAKDNAPSHGSAATTAWKKAKPLKK